MLLQLNPNRLIFRRNDSRVAHLLIDKGVGYLCRSVSRFCATSGLSHWIANYTCCCCCFAKVPAKCLVNHPSPSNPSSWRATTLQVQPNLFQTRPEEQNSKQLRPSCVSKTSRIFPESLASISTSRKSFCSRSSGSSGWLPATLSRRKDSQSLHCLIFDRFFCKRCSVEYVPCKRWRKATFLRKHSETKKLSMQNPTRFERMVMVSIGCVEVVLASPNKRAWLQPGCCERAINISPVSLASSSASRIWPFSLCISLARENCQTELEDPTPLAREASNTSPCYHSEAP